jgi:hypothetical protein
VFRPQARISVVTIATLTKAAALVALPLLFVTTA